MCRVRKKSSKFCITDSLEVIHRSHVEYPRWEPVMHPMVIKRFPTRQTFNSSPPSAAYIRQQTGPTLVGIMTCRLFCAKSLPEPMLTYCQLDSKEQMSVKFKSWSENAPENVVCKIVVNLLRERRVDTESFPTSCRPHDLQTGGRRGDGIHPVALWWKDPNDCRAGWGAA